MYLPKGSLHSPKTQELKDRVRCSEPSNFEMLIGVDANAQYICYATANENQGFLAFIPIIAEEQTVI